MRLLGEVKCGANSPRSKHYAPPPHSHLVCRPSRSISSCGGLSRSYIHSAVLVFARRSLSPDLSRYALYFSALGVVGCRFPSAHFVIFLLMNGVPERVLSGAWYLRRTGSRVMVISQMLELSVVRADDSQQYLQIPAFSRYPASLSAVRIPPDAPEIQSRDFVNGHHT